MSETNTTPTPQGDPEQLGDAGKAALVAERKRADDAEKRVRELEADVARVSQERDQAATDAAAKEQSLTERITALETENGTLKTDNTRLGIGLEMSLPRDLVDRMRGDDEAALRADAETLKAFVPKNSTPTFPKADPSQGAKTSHVGGTNADRFADLVDAKLN